MKKVLSLILAVIMILSIVPVMQASAVTLIWPVPGHTNLSQGFHGGSAIDISDGGIAGATVVAAMGGTVTHKWTCSTQHLDYGDCNGFGTGIVISGDDGRIYQYAHMQGGSIPGNVYVGARVEAGQTIGKVGTTGYSTGYHLHFGISKGNYWNQSGIDPSKETYGNPHTHSYSSSITKSATCTETGVKSFRCSCGASYTETISALGHSFGNWITVSAPTEQATGSAKRTCTRCGKTESKTLSKLVYNSDGWCYKSTLPDYISASDYTIQYQNIYEKTETSSPGSDWVRGNGTTTWQNSGDPYVRYTDEATSDSKILVKKIYYHVCGPTTGNVSNHSFEGGFVHYDSVDPASVNAQYAEDDAGHSVYVLYWKSNGQLVWCQSGVTCDGSHGTHGKRCKGWYVENTYQNRVQVTTYKYTKTSAWSSSKDSSATTVKYRFQPKHTHAWDGGTITKAATCTATGVKTYTCTVCKTTKTETIAKTAHKEQTISAVAATCAKTGLTAGKKCSVCGTIIVAQQTVAKTSNHNWDAGKITKTATATEKGLKTFTCTVCGKTKTEPIAVVKSGTYGDENNIRYTLDDKYVLTLSGSGCIGSELPPWETYKDKITKIIIGEGITDIQFGMFSYYDSLESVEFPSSLEGIPASCFESCNTLKSIRIPDTCDYIGDGAFINCYDLSSIALGSGLTSIGLHAFEGTAFYRNESNWNGKILYSGNYLLDTNFYNQPSGKVTVKSGTKTIAVGAFYSCEKMTSISIPESVENIGYAAFEGCTALTSVKLPSKLKTIEHYLFHRCSDLESIYIPSAVKTIEDGAFWGARNIEDIYYYGGPDQWKAIKVEHVSDPTVADGGFNSKNSILNSATIHYICTNGTAHTYDAGRITKAATATAEGKKVFTCTVCGATKTEKIAKLAVKPATPVGVKARASGEKSIIVSWDAVEGANQYNVYRYSSSKKTYILSGKVLATAENPTEYKFSGLTAGRKYYFNVTAVTGETESEKSRSANATAVGRPATPTNFKITSVSTTSAKLTWDKVDGATGYRIYKYKPSTGKYYKKGEVKNNKATIKNLAAGNKYEYVVVALKTVGDETLMSKKSALLTVYTKTNPTTITKLTSTKSKSISLAWSSVIGAKKYVIYKSFDAKNWTKVGSMTKTSGKISKNLTGGKRVYIKIYAVNYGGYKSAASAVKSVIVKR